MTNLDDKRKFMGERKVLQYFGMYYFVMLLSCD